jgi:hypothetical protein
MLNPNGALVAVVELVLAFEVLSGFDALVVSFLFED